MDVLAGRVDGARETVDEVYAWTDGQPYVTQRVCVALQEEGGRSVAQRVAGIVERLFLRGGPTSDGSLATAARLRATELLLTGMVARSPGGGGGCVRNRIFREGFDRQWIEALGGEWRFAGYAREWLDAGPDEAALPRGEALRLSLALGLACDWLKEQPEREEVLAACSP